MSSGSLLRHKTLPSDTLPGLLIRYKVSKADLRRANPGCNLEWNLPPIVLIPRYQEERRRDDSEHGYDPTSNRAQVLDKVTRAVHGDEDMHLAKSEIRAYLELNDWDAQEALENMRRDHISESKTEALQKTMVFVTMDEELGAISDSSRGLICNEAEGDLEGHAMPEVQVEPRDAPRSELSYHLAGESDVGIELQSASSMAPMIPLVEDSAVPSSRATPTNVVQEDASNNGEETADDDSSVILHSIDLDKDSSLKGICLRYKVSIADVQRANGGLLWTSSPPPVALLPNPLRIPTKKTPKSRAASSWSSQEILQRKYPHLHRKEIKAYLVLHNGDLTKALEHAEHDYQVEHHCQFVVVDEELADNEAGSSDH